MTVIHSALRERPWMPSFLDALRKSGSVSAACAAAVISRNTVYTHRRKNRKFASKWDAASNEAYEQQSRAAWESANSDPRIMRVFRKIGIPMPDFRRTGPSELLAYVEAGRRLQYPQMR